MPSINVGAGEYEAVQQIIVIIHYCHYDHYFHHYHIIIVVS